MKHKAFIIVFVVYGLMPAYARANELLEYGYLGLAAGRTEFDADDGENDRDSSWDLHGGYWLNPYVAVEGFFRSQGNQEEETDSINFNSRSSMDVDSFGVGLVAKKSFGSEGIGTFIKARAGVARLQADVDWKLCSKLDGTCQSNSDEDSTTAPYIGVGIGYDFDAPVSVALTYDMMEGDLDLNGSEKTLKLKTLLFNVDWRF